MGRVDDLRSSSRHRLKKSSLLFQYYYYNTHLPHQCSRWVYSILLKYDVTLLLLLIDPAKILALQAIGGAGFLNTVGAKKVTVKQGELVQLVCTVAGYPEPTVQWTKKVSAYYYYLLCTECETDSANIFPRVLFFW